MDHGLLLQPDFYSDERLKQYFGPNRISRRKIPSSDIVSISRRELKPDLRDKSNPYGMEGFDVIFYRTLQDGQLTEVKFSLTALLGKYAGLTYEDVKNLFGAAWQEDKEAEERLFLAITREPWNPPPKEPTHVMGSKIIRYAFEVPNAKNVATFEFNFDGTLSCVDFMQSQRSP